MNGVILKVYFFLATSCPISQQYTAYINKFASSSRLMGIETTIVFPTGNENINKEVSVFLNTYSVSAPYIIDRRYRFAQKLHASVTPEVFVLNDKDEILYHGAIDNWFYALGENRINITSHYLEDAIQQLLQKQKVTLPFVKPVGCFIEMGKTRH